MQIKDAGDAWPTGAFGLAGGCTAVVVAALVTAAVVAPGHEFVRAVLMAVAVGAVAAVLVDRRASAGAAVVAALIFVGFLAHRDGVLTGDASAWPYAIMIGLGVLPGRIERRLRRSEESGKLAVGSATGGVSGGISG
jgi:hypothetical protein